MREFSRSGPVFPIPQGTLPYKPILCQNCGKITYPLHLALCHSEKKWDVATSMCALTAQMMPLYRVKIVKFGPVTTELTELICERQDMTRPKNWCI